MVNLKLLYSGRAQLHDFTVSVLEVWQSLAPIPQVSKPWNGRSFVNNPWIRDAILEWALL